MTTPTNNRDLLMSSPTVNACKCETEETVTGEETRADSVSEPGTIANALTTINSGNKGKPLAPSPDIEGSGGEQDVETVYE